MTIDLILARLREGELDLSPDFQRRANLWNDQRKSGLIESLLLRIPIPSFYVSEDENGNYAVVDGLQRMCAIAHFVDVGSLNKAVGTNLPPLQLTGLQSLQSDCERSLFDDLARPLKRRIKETVLTLHVIRASTPAEVKFNIFSRINQGGLPLSSQEIRNAIYPGSWRVIAKEIAESAAFLSATDSKVRGERMQDVELILRFLAHYSLPADEARPDDQNLDDFLNNFVKNSVRWTESQWVSAARGFDRAMRFAPRIFGIHAFRKYYGSGYARSPINRGLFEAQSVVLARMSEDELEALSGKKEAVLASLCRAFERDRDFISSLLYATGRGSSSNKRISAIEEMLREVLND
jgi:hypothetical protein